MGFYCVCIPSKVVIFYCKSLNSLCYFIDVNECLFEELYTCVDEFQRCVNTLGSYKCECDQGLYFIDGECRGKKNFTPLRIYFRFSFLFLAGQVTTSDANLSMASNVTSYSVYKGSFKKGKGCFDFTMPTFVIG